jgi:hypothetical protein
MVDIDFLLVPLLLLLTTVVAAPSRSVRCILTAMPPLRAYAVASRVRSPIAAFTLLSAAAPRWPGSCPRRLHGSHGLATRLSADPPPRPAIRRCLLVVAWSAAPGQSWSAYYRIDEYTQDGLAVINVNGVPHQGMWPVDAIGDPLYEQVYRWFPERRYDRVLVIGAGTGTDVALALDRGAQHVDAVEIDGTILAIGIRDHPNHPYDDPRVTRIVDDGRAFLRRSTDSYDLVVFALPDSLTLISTAANVRLESFLFTH